MAVPYLVLCLGQVAIDQLRQAPADRPVARRLGGIVCSRIRVRGHVLALVSGRRFPHAALVGECRAHPVGQLAVGGFKSVLGSDTLHYVVQDQEPTRKCLVMGERQPNRPRTWRK